MPPAPLQTPAPGTPASVPGWQDHSPRPPHRPSPPVMVQVKGIANPCLQLRDPAVAGPRPRPGPRPLLRAAVRQPGPAPSLGSGTKAPTSIPLPTPLAGPPRLPRACSAPGHPEVRPPPALTDTLISFPLLSGNSGSSAGRDSRQHMALDPFSPRDRALAPPRPPARPRPSRRLPTLDTRGCRPPPPPGWSPALPPRVSGPRSHQLWPHARIPDAQKGW